MINQRTLRVELEQTLKQFSKNIEIVMTDSDTKNHT